MIIHSDPCVCAAYNAATNTATTKIGFFFKFYFIIELQKYKNNLIQKLLNTPANIIPCTDPLDLATYSFKRFAVRKSKMKLSNIMCFPMKMLNLQFSWFWFWLLEY